jgi:alpha-glucosidase
MRAGSRAASPEGRHRSGERQIAINPHEPIKDTGLGAPIPIGCRAKARAAWSSTPGVSPPNPPEHEANLVFTRMLAGPMDFTPASEPGGAQPADPSTQAKQLALYVVLYSPSRWRRT